MRAQTEERISIPEAGRRLGFSAKTVKRIIDRGLLKPVRIPGCHPRLSAAAVEALARGTAPAA